jgi:hypothetical protein
MERPVVFSIQVERGEEPTPDVDVGGGFVYLIIIAVSLIILGVIAVSLFLIRKRMTGSDVHPEKIFISHGDPAPGGHQHEHAPVLDPAHPVHHHHHPPDHAPDQEWSNVHHYHPHAHDQSHHDAVGFDKGTRNMK